MKEIKIKKTSLNEKTLKFQGEDKELDYKDLMELVLDIPPQQGFTPKDLRDRNRIQISLDSAEKGTIKLEDADFENFVKILDGSRWPTRDKQILEFIENFKENKK